MKEYRRGDSSHGRRSIIGRKKRRIPDRQRASREIGVRYKVECK